jgi:hypothetical protein
MVLRSVTLWNGTAALRLRPKYPAASRCVTLLALPLKKTSEHQFRPAVTPDDKRRRDIGPWDDAEHHHG